MFGITKEKVAILLPLVFRILFILPRQGTAALFSKGLQIDVLRMNKPTCYLRLQSHRLSFLVLIASWVSANFRSIFNRSERLWVLLDRLKFGFTVFFMPKLSVGLNQRFIKFSEKLLGFFKDFRIWKAVFGLVEKHYCKGLWLFFREQVFVQPVTFPKYPFEIIAVCSFFEVFFRNRNAKLYAVFIFRI